MTSVSYEFSLTQNTLDATILSGETYNYSFTLYNTGMTDSYTLTVTGADPDWSYTLLNALANATIHSLTVNGNSSQSFIVQTQVPLTVSNGEADSITVNAVSQGDSSLSQDIEITTSTPLYSFTSKSQSMTSTTIVAGESCYYTIQIQNAGNYTDTYLITSQGNDYTVSIRNSTDTTTITQITLDASATDTFLVKVDVPLTIANADFDAMTITMISTGRSSLSDSIQLTTSTPFYSFTAQAQSLTSLIDPGESYNYTIDIQNSGNAADTYLLTTQGEMYTTTFRNASDSASITQITINSSATDTFIVKVTVPLTATNGGFDAITITMTSDGRTSLSDSIQLTTSTPFIAFTAQAQSVTATLNPGESYNYTIQIENTGSATDTYALTTQDAVYDYVFRDASDSTTISQITINPSSTDTIIAKVTLPLTAANGGFDAITVTMTSTERTSVSNSIQLTTSTPLYSFTAQVLSLTATTLDAGESYNYTIQIQNTGTSTDTYLLTTQGAVFSYTFRNASDSATITQITINASGTGTFIAKVTVPLTVADGDVDGVTILMTSVGRSSVSDSLQLTTTVPLYSFTAQSQSSTTIVIVPGASHNYTIQIENTGTFSDTYLLTTQGGLYSYSLRNASDSASITQLTIDQSLTDTFIAKVTVPLTVANADFDSITIHMTSLGKTSVSDSIQLTTATPYYAFTAQAQSLTSMIAPGASYNYTIQLQNTGNITDTYLLTGQGDIYPYTFRNASDSAAITQITINASSTDTFIAKVTMPLTAANGDFDAMTITMTSVGRTSESNSIQLTTSTPFYAFTAQAQSLTSLIDPGESYNYTIQVQNTGNSTDTYILTTQGEQYSSTFRNASDSASITQISINASVTDTFIVKVTVPLTATNGGYDAITITMTSEGRTSISDSIQLTTSTPFFAFTAQAQSLTAMLNPGESYNYTIQIENTGSATDTYALTTQDAVYDYVFRDASDSTTISQITINPSSTDTIIAKVTLPLTAANGGFDAITITMTSTERTSVSNSIQLTTSTPLYSFTAQVLSLTETTLNAGESYNYTIQIQNTGTSTDTYLLTTQGDVYPYTFRNAADSATITQITINASGTDTFIAKVTVPLTVANGDSDAMTIDMTSIVRSTVSNSLDITTSTHLYSFESQTTAYTSMIDAGESYNYTIQIQNTGTTADTYLLTTQGDIYSYTFRNASDSASITQITIQASGTDTFIAKVTVPLTVANGDYDGVTILMTSLGRPSVSDSVQLTTTVPFYSFTAQSQSSITVVIVPGASHNYTIQIENTGTSSDTYLLTTQGGLYSYSLRNASDSASITQLTIDQSLTDTFIAKVTVPLTVANADFDSITIHMTSLGRTSVSESIQLTTATPYYAFTAQAQSLTSMIAPGASYNYTIQLQNTGNITDTYLLTGQGDIYPYTFRNASDSAAITQITINASTTDTFIAKVTMPLTAVNGDFDAMTITMTSVGRTSVSNSIQLTTSTPFYAFTAQAQSLTSLIDPGESYNYTIQIQNTGNATDTYLLTSQGELYPYTIRNASDSATITKITIGSSATDTFIVKVTLPITSTNGGFDAITITMTSDGRTSISDSIELTTSTPLYALSAQAQSLTATLNPGESFYYTIQIQNTGTAGDTYYLTTQNTVYPYVFRNASDSATITQITINASATETIFAKVSLPVTVANGDSDVMIVHMTSTGRTSVSDSIQLTTSTPFYSFTAQVLSLTSTTLYPGESFNYTIQIQNTGTATDTYLLTTQGAAYPYTFRNASDSATITQITIGALGTDTFIAKVTVPLTVANGGFDTMIIHMTSFGRPTVSNSLDITTATHLFSFASQADAYTTMIDAGESFNYTIQIENTGTTVDTYLLTTLGNLYPYIFRNASDSATITQITINSLSTDTFIAKVSVPLTVVNGDDDSVTIKMTSLGRPAVSDSLQFTTTVPFYSFNAQSQSPATIMIVPGASYNYTIQIENTGTAADTYLLTTQGGNYAYTFRNASDSADITQITIDKSLSDTFIAKVTVPLTVANGDFESFTVNITSDGRTSISDSLQFTTTTPYYAFTAQAQSVTSTLLFAGESYYYTIDIQNTGNSTDTYHLTTQGAHYQYTFRNASDSAAITQISLNASETDTVLAKVTVPLTAANGDFECITVTMTSLGLSAVSNSLELTTKSHHFSFNMGAIIDQKVVYPGKSFNYTIYVHNTGTADDTYTLTHANSSWSCSIRDITDTTDIHSISVGKGLTQSCLVKVTVPTTGLLNGESKNITLTAVSFAHTSVTNDQQVTTSIPIYGYSTQLQTNTMTVNPGQSYYYSLNLHNTGTGHDIYNLSLGEGSFNYVIRNAFDNATLRAVEVNAGYSETVLIKVSVPLEGISNGQSDTITIHTRSQSPVDLSDQKSITTNTSVFSSDMTAYTNTVTVGTGDSYAYSIQIQNNGAVKETFDLSLSQGSFSYVIRNKQDTATIQTLSIEPGSTETFIVIVNVPKTGVTNGMSDIINVNAKSQGNLSISYTLQLVTQVPDASFNMTPVISNKTIKPGGTYDYVISIQNNGQLNDTYNLIPGSGNFDYAIRNASDDAMIRNISVHAGQTGQYLLKVTVPFTGLSNGQSDTITIDAISHNNPAVSNNIVIVTNTPSFSHAIVNLSGDRTIYPGRSFNYLLAIENEGLSNDTYNLALSSGDFSYTLRNASDTADIHAISVQAGLSSTFIVKAIYPSEGAANGQSDSIQITSVSQSRNLDTSSVQLITSTPMASFGITNVTGDAEVYPGTVQNYEMLIANDSLVDDTFALSINGGSWAYSIRNASDTSNIYSVSVGAGITQTFLVKVLIPKGVTNGSSETITLHAESQANRSITQQNQITTSTPMFAFSLQKLTGDTTLKPGQSFNYSFVIDNTSSGDDTYSLTKTTGKWSYAIRNATNTANINTISVPSGMTASFLVNVSVPITQISQNDIDAITLNVVSLSNDTVNAKDCITTDISSYGFSIQNINGNATIYSGQIHNYIIQLQNTGAASDTYHLSVDGGAFDYSIRNVSDRTTIDYLSVDSGATEEFIIKVAAPLTDIANGQTDTITLTVDSIANIRKSLTILTSTPECQFSMTSTTTMASLIPGDSKLFQISINNDGQFDDTYYLSILGGTWAYSILSAVDNSVIDSLFVGSNATETFNVSATVPSSGISVGDSDTINLLASSACTPYVISQVEFTTYVPAISYNMQTSSNNEMVFLGQSYGYRIDIHNLGTRSETYDLSISSAEFSYELRNEIDSATIQSITVPPDAIKTYLAKVTVPTTGVANAQSDTVTTYAVPQGDSSDIKQIQLVTTTPTFAATIHQVSPSDIVYPGQSKGYLMQIDNTGASMDTYSLSIVGGNWQYFIRNADDIASIDTVTVDSGYTGVFLVKAEVPITNVANGDSDTVTINAMSQGNNSINYSTQITTTTPTFSYRITNLTQTPKVYPGNSYNHEIQIENTGINDDSYNVSLSGGEFSYVVRNLGDYAYIDSIFVEAGATNSFIIKVTVPTTGISNAQSDTVTIHTVSQGNKVVTSDYQVSTQTPEFSARIVRLDNKALVYPGKSHYYPVYLENTGSAFDSFDLSVSDGQWTYHIINTEKTANIDNLLMAPGVSEKFLVKVTVPFTGIANGDSDTATVRATSQGLNSVESSFELVTDSPFYEFHLDKLTPNKTLFLGETFDYHIEINNTGSANDCYSLTVSGGNWKYTLRNADDNTNITSIPMQAGYSETFILRVTMPQTGVASGEAETVTVLAQSQNNNTVSDNVLVTTASPFYDLDVARTSFPPKVNTGETYHYKVEFNNTGNIIDTYHVSLSGGSWTYTIRNASDTDDLTTITLDAGIKENIVVSASVPLTHVFNGDTDSITLSVVSVGNPSITADIPFVITAANYAFNMVKHFDNAIISPELSAVYELQINNTDTSDDSYVLSVLDGSWSYVFRNASDTKDLTSVSVPAMGAKEFFVKVTVPTYGTAEGMAKTATVQAVSMGKSSVTDQVVIASKVGPESTSASFKSIKETNDSTVNM